MFVNDKSIDTLTDLFKEIKKYITLQGQYAKLEIVEKLTTLLSMLILIFIIVLLVIMAVFYFSSMLVYILASLIGSWTLSYAIIGIFLLLTAFIVYKMRRQLIVKPMVNFLAKLFLEDHH